MRSTSCRNSLLFQFHLVRLKVERYIPVPLRSSFVSIPFSTIKRRSEPEGDRLREVSIPFSTIKSLHGAHRAHEREVFQFHLVRLKEKRGSITPAPRKFQFHLVRLKDALFCHLVIYQQFQFHLVRLKESLNAKIINRWKFQFHLVRLKDTRQPTAKGGGKSFNSI